MRLSGMTYVSIAETVGMKFQAVYHRLRRAGAPRVENPSIGGCKPVWVPLDIEKYGRPCYCYASSHRDAVRLMHELDYHVDRMVEVIGSDRNIVRTTANRMGLRLKGVAMARRGIKRKKKPKARAPLVPTAEIQRMFDSGMTYDEIGEKIGRHPTTVWNRLRYVSGQYQTLNSKLGWRVYAITEDRILTAVECIQKTPAEVAADMRQKYAGVRHAVLHALVTVGCWDFDKADQLRRQVWRWWDNEDDIETRAETAMRKAEVFYLDEQYAE